MPQMSGREIAASLQPLCSRMKVLYMSGYTDSAIVQHGVLEAGINFIQKPFNPDGLVRAIRNVLDS
jgi:FixJ family two-component response regulator